jgi:sugar phosphate isomerase/epimerase
MAGMSGCATTGVPAPGQAPGFFERTGLSIGLQVYTLGPEAGDDLDATFAEIAEIGYRDIEMPGLLGHPASAVRAAAARAGLAISSIHVPLATMGQGGGLTFENEASALADTLGELGASWAVAPIALFPDGFRPGPGDDFAAAIGKAFAAAGPEVWQRTAELLNRKGEALKPLGIRTGYHNHNLEFAPIGETTGWDILVAETDPGIVSFEIDLGWVAAAGLDPVAFLARHSGRIALIHVKDIAAGSPAGYALSMNPTQVGEGTQAWDVLLPAAHSAGARHFYVEQEPPFAIPRMEAAQRGYEFLAKLEA